MNLKNIILASLFCGFSLFVIVMCGGAAYKTGEFVPFEYSIPDGMITDEAEKEAMITAKVQNLEATNEIYWGKLPSNKEDLQILFNDIWSFIRTVFPGFKGLDIDWDKYGEENYYRIEEIDNYGEFARMATYMAFVLQEGHSNISTGRISGKNRLTPFRKNVPLFNTDIISRIDACYTITDKEELVITRAGKDNPYKFRAGDEIVGFNGVPWQEWVDRLLNSKIPIYGSPASSKGAIRYKLLKSGLTNATMFEKINIKRYGKEEVETLDVIFTPFSLGEYDPCYEYITDVPGVKTPKISVFSRLSDVMTYGIIKDTNIGYIYSTECPAGFEEFSGTEVWDPYETEFSREFSGAVSKLMGTDGLIIDLRYNTGGKADPYYRGLARLVKGEDDLELFTRLERDHEKVDITALKEIEKQRSIFRGEKPDVVYGKPIVVLTSPDCISACDFLIATLAKFPETSNIIGLDNNGSFSGVSGETYSFGDDTISRYIPLTAGAYYDESDIENKNFELLLRRSFVKTHIWYTKEDVANKRDTVREYAINLIKEQNGK